VNDPEPFNPLAISNLAESVVTQLLASAGAPLTDISDIDGAGVYAIYYTGATAPFAPYADLASANVDELTQPIYVGKAIPAGGRKGVAVAANSRALVGRLREHRDSVVAANNLAAEDFAARWLVVEDIWIPLGESLLISRFSPLWNALIDGFGNHDPGAGRRKGMRSRWDTLHPGRGWADLLPSRPEAAAALEAEAREYLRSRLT